MNTYKKLLKAYGFPTEEEFNTLCEDFEINLNDNDLEWLVDKDNNPGEFVFNLLQNLGRLYRISKNFIIPNLDIETKSVEINTTNVKTFDELVSFLNSIGWNVLNYENQRKEILETEEHLAKRDIVYKLYDKYSLEQLKEFLND